MEEMVYPMWSLLLKYVLSCLWGVVVMWLVCEDGERIVVFEVFPVYFLVIMFLANGLRAVSNVKLSML